LLSAEQTQVPVGGVSSADGHPAVAITAQRLVDEDSQTLPVILHVVNACACLSQQRSGKQPAGGCGPTREEQQGHDEGDSAALATARGRWRVK